MIQETITNDIELFRKEISEGIPTILPQAVALDPSVSHAPRRKEILNADEKKLALKNALRYFEAKDHAELIKEFSAELQQYGRIYMYRLRPKSKMHARPIE